MGNRTDDYIKARESLATKLNREPTPNEIEEEMVSKEAEKIDAAYEQAREGGNIVL